MKLGTRIANFLIKFLKKSEWKQYALDGEWILAIKSLREFGGVPKFQDARNAVDKFMDKNGIIKKNR